MIKTIYSAKPNKNGYKITRYLWNGEKYTDIKGLYIVADMESANAYLKVLENNAKANGFKTEIEKTKKWIFLTIEGNNTEKPKPQKQEQEIAISLYPSEWQEIADACIYIADWIELEKGYEIPKETKDALRKTYYTIKQYTR